MTGERCPVFVSTTSAATPAAAQARHGRRDRIPERQDAWGAGVIFGRGVSQRGHGIANNGAARHVWPTAPLTRDWPGRSTLTARSGVRAPAAEGWSPESRSVLCTELPESYAWEKRSPNVTGTATMASFLR